MSSRHSILEPGNLLIVQERERHLQRIFRRLGIERLEGLRIFEAGCGGGYNLRLMLQWGARPEDLAGIDIDEPSVEYCRAHTAGVRLHVGSADTVPEPDQSFDLAIAFTLFSSVPDEAVSQAIAREMVRVTRPGGHIFIYDMRRTNPWNPGVHKVTSQDVRRWFPGCPLRTSSLTLVPVLARPLGRRLPALYGPLAALPPLRSHALYVLRRPAFAPSKSTEPALAEAALTASPAPTAEGDMS